MRRSACIAEIASACVVASATLTAIAQPILEQQLVVEDPRVLAQAAREAGDAARGAIVFHQPHIACTRCHALGENENPLGPDLTTLPEDATDVHLVESLLLPSKTIREGYEPVAVFTFDGLSITGLQVKNTDDQLVLRDPDQDGKVITLDKDDIDEFAPQKTSVMPIGQVNQLASRQQFLDLIRYVMEIRDGGRQRAVELQPLPSAIALQLPEYEQHIDHAGFLDDLGEASYERGEAIYDRVCMNCHGTVDQPGSLPTSLRFASEKFKNGSDPFTMYQTLTRGFGMMVPQTWMVPQQKYDVIHYIREAYLKEHNPTQYFGIGRNYLAGLPAGDTRGPEPLVIEPWVTMDYGPSLINTYEVGRDETNFAYKGIAVRLDPGPGGVSRGTSWVIFDHDTLRAAAGWTGEGFIDWNGIHFNGKHQVHPSIVGHVQFANSTGPGWRHPETGSFEDPRLRGRDNKPYGPLPRDWAHYRGLYHHLHQVIVAYTVGTTEVLELPGIAGSAEAPVFTRTFNLGPRARDMILQVAQQTEGTNRLRLVMPEDAEGGAVAVFGAEPPTGPPPAERLAFEGATYVEIADAAGFDLTHQDFTVAARIKTLQGGTIFSKTLPNSEWVPDGKSLFVRGGKLCFDIGWVGAVQSHRKVDDGRWHDVAMTWNHQTALVRLYVDGRMNAERVLRPKGDVDGHVVRIGFSASNFPRPDTFFAGELDDIRLYRRELNRKELAGSRQAGEETRDLVARWRFDKVHDQRVEDITGHGHDAAVRERAGQTEIPGLLVAGLSPPIDGAEWSSDDAGRLRLRIPAGPASLKFNVWLGRVAEETDLDSLLATVDFESLPGDLTPLTQGGPPRWAEVLTTNAMIGADDGPFAVDALTHPASNPWLAQVRLTGFDFFPDGDRAAVAAWDGDIWLVSGLNGLPPNGSSDDRPVDEAPPLLTWQRIASGLFQPLGLKIVRGKIYVTCRDQIVILHDLDGDGETDFYENFNNDHQVTDHFHEFAMDLQIDEEGNFYYAKGARHALPALVPHHGTLLRVSRDGSRTDILANGFRAPNGVCLNPDGTFMLTDQEGHWMPKNRINLVEIGGYYGNHYGYHDVTDPSDDAMEQPVVWITNAVDRSPSELLWVNSDAWGPLQGSLLNLSYGYGKIYVIPHETVNGEMQGGICELPLPRFPTGTMRGRFHPRDRQLYTCGMFAWASDQQQPGGFYRVRHTGQPMHLPVGLAAMQGGIAITFTDRLDRPVATQVSNYAAMTWTLKRSAEYGSDHYNERRAVITAARLSDDGRTVFLEIPRLETTWCMEIKYSLMSAAGHSFRGMIHNTIHQLGGPSAPVTQSRAGGQQGGDE